MAERNLRAERSSLLARTRRIEARIAVPAGERTGRLRGYASLAERHGKVIRLQVQSATGAVRYDITLDPVSGRWYLDASWRTFPQPAPPLGDLRQAPVVAVDVNAGHLAAAVVAADGNIVGVPVTVPLDLAGLSAATRPGSPRPFGAAR